MTSNTSGIGYDDGDIDTNRSASRHLSDLVSERYSRRQTLMGGMSAMATAVFGSTLLAACGDDDDDGRDAGAGFTVSATSSGETKAGRLVTLTGTVTGGSASSVAWAQTSGPAVTLTNATSNVATFIAPAVATPTNLGFRFTGAGANLATTSASVTVLAGAPELGFAAVPKSLADVVAVPAGYTVSVLYRLGDPIAASAPAYANNGTDGDFARRAGDHHDGMSYFGLAAAGNAPDAANSTRGLLVLNHENITQAYLHANGPTTVAGARPEAEAIKEIEAHGVSVIEVSRADAGWSYKQDSALNRRITPNTPMAFHGPARGDANLRTAYSPDGTGGRGTINNCANGSTPWHSYLTNEENWAGYFRRNAGDAGVRTTSGRAQQNVSLARYGISEGRSGNYGWTTVAPVAADSTVFRRWNATASAALPADGTGDFRNEPFQFGWVVEIDPFDPASTPRKRTALGRMNHEGCQIGRTVAGVRPAFYMGDDAQNEYIYKFVSQQAWAEEDAKRADRLAVGDKYLDAGTLYVARFDASGEGQWLPLEFGKGPLTAANGFASQADVLIHARLAADALGATPMDRPEWTAVNPATGEMYCTLTNNSNRAVAPASTSQRAVDAANPRAYLDPRTDGRSPGRGNVNGHVVRLREAGDTSEATRFTWDIFAFGAGSDLDPATVNLSDWMRATTSRRRTACGSVCRAMPRARSRR